MSTDGTFKGRTPNALDAPRVAELDAFLEEARRVSKIPGLAVAIVEGGTVVLAKGYGVRALGTRDAVTPDTYRQTQVRDRSLTAPIEQARAADARVARKAGRHPVPWWRMHLAPFLRFVIIAALVVFLVRRLLRWPRIWELSIAAFDRAPVTDGAVVFMGSSSIRFWATLAQDMAPLPALNRGFGGATVAGVVFYARRILARARAPRAILLYAGVNDLAWGVSEDRVLEDTQRFLALAAELAPGAPLYLLSLQLTPSRPRSWARVLRVNERLARLAAESNGRVRYVDLATSVLDARGRPRRELFVLDGIHMNRSGYALWTAILRPRLLEDLGPR